MTGSNQATGLEHENDGHAAPNDSHADQHEDRRYKLLSPRDLHWLSQIALPSGDVVALR
jgi:hypothetical protein